MYTLDSTHGLRTSAESLIMAAAILGQHLTKHYRQGQIDWLITGPTGAKTHGGIQICASPAEEAQEIIADSVNSMIIYLADVEAQDYATLPC